MSDRERILALAAHLGTNKTMRDTCGDYYIAGKGENTIYIHDKKHFSLVLVCKSKTQYNNGKEKLSFLKQLQDGDTEGSFLMDALPTKEQSNTILKLFGIRKKRILTEEQLVELKLRGERLARRNSAPAFK